MARFGLILMILALAAGVSAQRSGYNELADSPTVTLEGCGVFPAARIVVDGRETEARGIIRGSRTFLPARESLEMLGASVKWVNAERSFYASIPERQRTVKVTVGSPVVRIYRYSSESRLGAGPSAGSVRMKATPFLCGGRIYAPVRAAVEATGGTVNYDSRTRTVSISAPRSNSAR